MTSASSKEEIVIVIGWKTIVIFLALILILVVGWKPFSERFGPGLTLSTEPEYLPGELVRIEGWARESWFTPLVSEPVAIEVRQGESVIWIDQTRTDASGHFASSFRLRRDADPGVYSVYVSMRFAQVQTTFSVRG